jgi:hypothetical protein
MGKEKEPEGPSLSSARSLVSSLHGLVFTPKPSTSSTLHPGKKPVTARQSETASDDITAAAPALAKKEEVAGGQPDAISQTTLHAESAEKDKHEGKRASFQLSSLFGGKASTVTNESSDGTSGEVKRERETCCLYRIHIYFLFGEVLFALKFLLLVVFFCFFCFQSTCCLHQTFLFFLCFLRFLF